MLFPHALPAGPAGQSTAAAALMTFVACAQLMLDAATPEPLRCRAETRLLAALPTVRALGLFDLFAVRHPALAAMLEDELAQVDAPAPHGADRA